MTEKQYNILLLGGGGREHALAWKLSQSPGLNQLYIAPGNAGTAQLGNNLAISEVDFPAIRNIVLEKKINLIVVGPEAPLVKGISDFFLQDPLLKQLPVIGPSAAAARLEGSKDFAKEFMIRHGIPTAPYRSFGSHQWQEACNYLKTIQPPYVIKADGLAAGKGVLICRNLEEAGKELTQILREGKFGEAGNKVVVEQFLQGIELSVFVITDGESFLLLPEAKDYKRIGDKDTGPNTGGMGSLSPVPFAGQNFMKKVQDQIIQPTLSGLMTEGIHYQGFIFFGLMKVGDHPYVIEYNARLGDPETEVIIPRIQNDLLELLEAVSLKQLSQHTLITDPRAASCVMLVAPGYPGSYPKGLTINGLDNISQVIPFHAGTSVHPETGSIISSGGRILALTALAESHQKSLEMVYQACQKIDYPGKYYRTDIGRDVISD